MNTSENILNVLREEEKIKHVPEDVLRIVSEDVNRYNSKLKYIADFIGRKTRIKPMWISLQLIQLVEEKLDEFIRKNYLVIENIGYNIEDIPALELEKYNNDLHILYENIGDRIFYNQTWRELLEEDNNDGVPFLLGQLEVLIWNVYKHFYK
jgi:hypothetical protein